MGGVGGWMGKRMDGHTDCRWIRHSDGEINKWMDERKEGRREDSMYRIEKDKTVAKVCMLFPKRLYYVCK